MRLRVYGEKGNPAFSAYDDNGASADFDSFEAVTPEARTAAISCVFSTPVATNGYRLGTHPSPTCVTVQVTAIGDRVEFTAPTVEIAHDVWSNHAAGIEEWLQETMRPARGVRIRVYGPADNPLLTNAIDGKYAYAEFDELDAMPGPLFHGFTYTVASSTPNTTCQPGLYTVRCEPSVPIDCLCPHHADGSERCMTDTIDAEVQATGRHVTVRSTNLNFAYTTWGKYMQAAAPGSLYAQQANQELMQLRENVNQD